MPRNDPTDTGGLFIGRRPGTAPLRFPTAPKRGTAARQRFDRTLAFFILVVETLLCLTLWGPQPAGWLWFGSHVQYWTGSVSAGIASSFAGMLVTLPLTLMIAKQLDTVWKIVRRAAGYHQERGALEWIFVVSIAVSVVLFCIWFFVIAGPGPSLAPRTQ